MVGDTTAQQAQHTRPTPRVGGVAIIVSMILGAAVLHTLISFEIIAVLVPGLLVFAAGMREDILRDVSPRARLCAAFASSVCAAGFSGILVSGLGFASIDWVLAVPMVGLCVTLLWSAGMCNALNLIDGLNGLASAYAIAALFGLMTIAGFTGDADIQLVAALLIAALAAFFLLNWPFGLIFMGDAGAYAIGHVIAWLGIVLMARNPEVSGFAVLMVLFWPVAETMFSVLRRRLSRKAADQPDRMHFHHILARFVGMVVGRKMSNLHKNSLTALIQMPLMAAPIVIGVLVWNNAAASMLCLGLFSLLYLFLYHALSQAILRRTFRRKILAAPVRRPRSAISPYSGMYIGESAAVEVSISRISEADRWSIVTSAHNATPKIWRDRFDTDAQAWEHFLATVKRHGVEVAFGPQRRRQNEHWTGPVGTYASMHSSLHTGATVRAAARPEAAVARIAPRPAANVPAARRADAEGNQKLQSL